MGHKGEGLSPSNCSDAADKGSLNSPQKSSHDNNNQKMDFVLFFTVLFNPNKHTTNSLACVLPVACEWIPKHKQLDVVTDFATMNKHEATVKRSNSNLTGRDLQQTQAQISSGSSIHTLDHFQHKQALAVFCLFVCFFYNALLIRSNWLQCATSQNTPGPEHHRSSPVLNNRKYRNKVPFPSFILCLIPDPRWRLVMARNPKVG